MLPGIRINDLPQAVEVPRAGAYDQQPPCLPEHPREFRKVSRRKYIQNHIKGGLCEGEVDDAGNKPVHRPVLSGGLADGKFRNVYSVVCNGGPGPGFLRQKLLEALEVKTLTTSGIKNVENT